MNETELPGRAVVEDGRERGPLANPEKVKRKELEAKLNRRLELEDITRILSTVEGRRFYWRLLNKCHVFESSFTGNNTTFFQEGERNVGLLMIAEMNEAAPEAYLKMLQESKNKGDQ